MFDANVYLGWQVMDTEGQILGVIVCAKPDGSEYHVACCEKNMTDHRSFKTDDLRLVKRLYN
jgi:hypothetical protein